MALSTKAVWREVFQGSPTNIVGAGDVPLNNRCLLTVGYNPWHPYLFKQDISRSGLWSHGNRLMKGQVVASSVHSAGEGLIHAGSWGVNAELKVWQNGANCLFTGSVLTGYRGNAPTNHIHWILQYSSTFSPYEMIPEWMIISSVTLHENTLGAQLQERNYAIQETLKSCASTESKALEKQT